MAKEREFVMLDSFDKYTDDALVEVLAQLEAEAEEAIAEVREENKRRSEEAIRAALDRAQRAGVTVRVDAGGDSAPGKKRGRKSAAEKAAEDAAKLANGHDSDEPAALDAE